MIINKICEGCPDRENGCGYCLRDAQNKKPAATYRDKLISLYDAQTQKGLREYGQRLEDNTTPGAATRRQYFREELLDAILYSYWIEDAEDKVKNDIIEKLRQLHQGKRNEREDTKSVTKLARIAGYLDALDDVVGILHSYDDPEEDDRK